MNEQLDNRYVESYRNAPLNAEDYEFNRISGKLSSPRYACWRSDGQIDCFLPHLHAAAELIYVSEGEMSVQTDSESFIARAGELLVFDPWQLHAGYLKKDQPAVRYTYAVWEPDKYMPVCMNYVGLAFTPAEYAASRIACRTRIRPEEGSGEIGALVKKLPALYAEQDGSGCAELRIAAALQEIFARLIGLGCFGSCEERARAFGRQMMEFLEEHYAETVTPDLLQKNFPYSRSYFCRLFRKTFGMPFSNYLSHYRIQRALSDFMNRDLDEMPTVSEISERVGFTDSCYFTHVFKAYVGLSPSAYIRSRRQKGTDPCQTTTAPPKSQRGPSS